MNTTAARDSELAVIPWPGLTPRLLRTEPGVEDLAGYRSAGGYQTLDDVDALLSAVELSGIVGRGGAAFPLAVKLRSVRAAWQRGQATVVVANGEEGEPASVKDRWLLRHRPHLVLDGLRLAARLVGAQHVHVYLSDPVSFNAVGTALGALDDGTLDGITVSVKVVDPGYVAGEETAAVRAINGGPAKPSDKPPRPFEEGVGGLPTMVSNVETLANLPFLHRHGAEQYRAAGTSTSPGTLLVTVTGGGRPGALYEVPFGVAFTELVAAHGVPAESVRGVLMGGYFAGLLNTEVLDVTLDHENLRRLDSGLGCGAISLITEECPVAVAAAVLSYFDRENAGQCGSCFNGTAAMAAVGAALRDGMADSEDLARLERWSVVLRGRGACATLDAATNTAASLLRNFPTEVARHLDNECPTCGDQTFRAERPFAVETVSSK
ncbi:NADH-ubiquinone oxidoreductase-F iron-sulfur binding region domain-containing protein [Mycolicibacterium mengxianglii]|uniref:NADH-ubiquinone oxidoreductase-F iron-sulfur binding region domain-containing protein n=1 Tax=Mycolicibacterium mengxianglii TaxID=2736649 RepID=UPI0018D050DC|nr:NADH-ubiquinone oxidoreductase-F iron-sulfur binding region domain-containing protein [Mycolicibacterium mengxianglii]